MRILILSDLHLESNPGWILPPLPDHDVVVLAGDIHRSPADGVMWAEKTFAKPVVYVLGNHEFYGGKIGDWCFGGAMAAMGAHVHLLCRGEVVVDGVRFLGATLWTDYLLHDDREAAMKAARDGMNDHRRILVPGGKFMPRDALAEHLSDRLFLPRETIEPFDGPTVVVTHHAPLPNSIDPSFARDPLTPAYASDLGGIIAAGKPDLWVHGHVHRSHDYLAGHTRVVCNPKGYGGGSRWSVAENEDFTMKVVEVEIMSKAFFTADTHFGHANIIGYCARPFASVEEMDEAMIANWNAVVGADDVVWHLGDFALRADAKHVGAVFRRLNGVKHLVLGNHDKQATRDLPWANRGGVQIADKTYDGQRAIMCHYGLRVWPGMQRGAISLYGHSHGRLPGSSLSLERRRGLLGLRAGVARADQGEAGDAAGAARSGNWT